MDNWVSALINKEHTKFNLIITQLRQLKQAVDNTENASWFELLVIKYLGTPAGGLIHDKKFYTYTEYKDKLYYIPDENTPTDLHS